MTGRGAAGRGTAESIAVAVPTRDRPEPLARCVDTLLAGDVGPGEVLVVDQSRDDATLRAIEARRCAGAPIRYLRIPPRGLSAARNAAAAATERPILAFTDDDCVPARGWVATLDRVFAESTELAAVTGPVLPLGPARPGLHAVSGRTSAVRAEYRVRALPWRVGTGGNTAVRRAWLERLGGFDERLGAGTPGGAGEDMDLLYRLLRAGGTIRYEPDARVFHERQSTARRLASRPRYGHGMGAFCALRLRRRDPYALAILARWCLDRGRILAGACLLARWRRAREEALMLRGAGAGLIYGLRLREQGDA
ncbi:MAG TPA: glycosyltransferase [Longimicrobiales bacterium]